MKKILLPLLVLAFSVTAFADYGRGYGDRGGRHGGGGGHERDYGRDRHGGGGGRDDYGRDRYGRHDRYGRQPIVCKARNKFGRKFEAKGFSYREARWEAIQRCKRNSFLTNDCYVYDCYRRF